MFPRLLKISYDNLRNKGMTAIEARDYLNEKYKDDADIIEDIYLGHSIEEDISINSNKVVDVSEFIPEEDIDEEVECGRLTQEDIDTVLEEPTDIEIVKPVVTPVVTPVKQRKSVYDQVKELYINTEDKSKVKSLIIGLGINTNTANVYYSKVKKELENHGQV